MDELVKQVAEKVGVSADQARTAVDTVVNFLKTRLPGPMAAQMDQVLAGGQTGGLGDQIKGMFGS